MIMQPTEAILNYLDAHQQDMVAYLTVLAKAESPSLNAASQQPVMEMLASSLNELNYKTLSAKGKNTGGYLNQLASS